MASERVQAGMRILVLAALAACHGSSPEHPPEPEQVFANAGPEVDAACIGQSRAGTLITSQPATIGAVQVTPTDHGVHLFRKGRALSEAEGKAVWAGIQKTFDEGGLKLGSSALMGSVRCSDVGIPACFELSLAVCQRSLSDLVTSLERAWSTAGAADGELGVNVDLLESYGPRCAGPSCMPAPHYSRASQHYDPTRARVRTSSKYSQGRCDSDGDCVGDHSNYCMSWYLRGGSEPGIGIYYIGDFNGPFCGCVESTCTWFKQ